MKRIYVDMDGVLCDYYNAHMKGLAENPKQIFPQSRFGFFTELEPLKDAIESFKKLQQHYDMWICTRPSYQNLSSYSEKAYWLRKYFGEDILNKTVMTANKSIVKGDYLIDDQTDWGQTEFEGKLILFGSEEFPNWRKVMDYFNLSIDPIWKMKYWGTNNFATEEKILQAAKIKILKNDFPILEVSASNEEIGNMQYYEDWQVSKKI